MPTVELTSENFDATITDNEVVVVDCWADWCRPCHRFAPIFAEAAERHPDVVFAKIDTEEETELARDFGISSVPTLLIFRQQILVAAQPGIVPGPAIDEMLDEIRNLDMEQVRKKVESLEEVPEELRGSDDDDEEEADQG